MTLGELLCSNQAFMAAELLVPDSAMLFSLEDHGLRQTEVCQPVFSHSFSSPLFLFLLAPSFHIRLQELTSVATELTNLIRQQDLLRLSFSSNQQSCAT